MYCDPATAAALPVQEAVLLGDSLCQILHLLDQGRLCTRPRCQVCAVVLLSEPLFPVVLLDLCWGDNSAAEDSPGPVVRSLSHSLPDIQHSLWLRPGTQRYPGLHCSLGRHSRRPGTHSHRRIAAATHTDSEQTAAGAAGSSVLE